jgi:hypothetical protein
MKNKIKVPVTSSYAANRTQLQMFRQATQMPFKKKSRTSVRGFQMYELFEVVGHNNQLENESQPGKETRDL